MCIFKTNLLTNLFFLDSRRLPVNNQRIMLHTEACLAEKRDVGRALVLVFC